MEVNRIAMFFLLISLYWTGEVIKNIAHVTAAGRSCNVHICTTRVCPVPTPDSVRICSRCHSQRVCTFECVINDDRAHTRTTIYVCMGEWVGGCAHAHTYVGLRNYNRLKLLVHLCTYIHECIILHCRVHMQALLPPGGSCPTKKSTPAPPLSVPSRLPWVPFAWVPSSSPSSKLSGTHTHTRTHKV